MKPLEEQTFADDFMFGWVIRHDAGICRQILKCLLGIKINKIKYLETQKKEKPSYQSKAVFLDVYADDGRVFDIEMQTTAHPALLKRARYYFAAIDTAQLETGVKYTELKDTYVIFICTFDPFGENKAVYEVQRTFAQGGASADNGTHELYFNAKAYESVQDVALRSFLRYTVYGDAATPLTQRIDKAVETQKEREECKAMYTMLDMARMDAQIEESAKSEALIKRLASDNKRMASDNKRMASDIKRINSVNSENARIIASMRAEIAALKQAQTASKQ